MIGLFFALAYLNREETIWLAPVVVSALAAVAFGTWWNRAWRPALRTSAGMLGALLLPIIVVSALNYDAYGVFLRRSGGRRRLRMPTSS